jgi:hypothetical protein
MLILAVFGKPQWTPCTWYSEYHWICSRLAKVDSVFRFYENEYIMLLSRLLQSWPVIINIVAPIFLAEMRADRDSSLMRTLNGAIAHGFIEWQHHHHA